MIKYRHRMDHAAQARLGALTAIQNDEPSMTQQAPAKDADINRIVARFGLGVESIPPGLYDPANYRDNPDLSWFDLRTALDQVRDAQARFMALPSRLRKQFDNDPAQLLDFLANPANREEAVALGLMKPSSAVTPPTPTPSPTPTPPGTAPAALSSA